MITNQLFEQHVTIRRERSEHSDISRLLAAAVVSRQFCALLLSDPARAIEMGYAGEHFSLNAEEYRLALSARGLTLQEFAQQICKYMPASKAPVKPSLSETYQLHI